MNIIFSIQHPAHVHKFKFAIEQLKKRHNVLVVVISKEMTTYLLNTFGINYIIIGKNKKGLMKKFFSLLKAEAKLLYISIKFKPDIYIGGGEPSTAHIAFFMNKPYLAFDDTEAAKIIIALYKPFTKTILTPNCFLKDFGEKQIRYNGYHELAYLHPRYFIPDCSILKNLGVKKDEKFVILRFVSWSASHDIGQKGLNLEMKRKTVREISKYAKLFISSEEKLPQDLKSYQIKIPFEKIHDVLHYATLYIGEGATMASECAILGTPAIYVNSITAGIIEDQERYGLLYSYRNFHGILDKARELIKTPNLKEEWKKRRDRMLKDKIDLTAYMVWFIENIPKSIKIMKENPELQERFK